MKYNKKQLEAQVEAIHNLSQELGLIGEGVESVLQEGTASYGVAWRLYSSPVGRYVHDRHPAFSGGDGFLGMTKTEAGEALGIIFDVLCNVRAAKINH